MSLKIVYAVTSSGKDVYSVMTRISVASVRLYCPGSRVVLACDEASALAMKQARDSLLKEVDEVMVVSTPEGIATYRNRHIKTRLRSLVEGKFLFMDSDTIVRGELNALAGIQGDIAAAPNHSADSLEAQIWDEDRAHLDTMDWTVAETYFNGGIIFFRDTPAARALGAEWHDRWMTGFRKTGRANDQPALNASIAALGIRVEKLPYRYNAQFTMNRSSASDALVWHYYSTDTTLEFTAIGALLKRVMENGAITNDKLIDVIRSSEPWRVA
jgi:hypothetical protein